ncbi:hypothetical protein GQ607_013745 [Colletotrichum asianum]|uniref:Uncharacterized protein n=1 Tax=Colletotrichum asianum TaxID=702518 RepID=A0A8H3W324_9PEZI|nr:hypothetical protein GQ607_013745 [Colletotrichum asianum]
MGKRKLPTGPPAAPALPTKAPALFPTGWPRLLQRRTMTEPRSLRVRGPPSGQTERIPQTTIAHALTSSSSHNSPAAPSNIKIGTKAKTQMRHLFQVIENAISHITPLLDDVSDFIKSTPSII